MYYLLKYKYILLSLPIVILLSYFIFKYIVNYIKYQYHIYDNNETIKENISLYKLKINHFKDYLLNTYSEYTEIYRNFSTQIDFCLNIINHRKNIHEQYSLVKELYDLCYETGKRLKEDFDNVTYINSPIKNFSEKIALDHIRLIRENISTDDIL